MSNFQLSRQRRVVMLTRCIFLFLCGVPELVFARNSSIDAKIERLVNNFGFPFETHEVETSDGYILGLHRIPRKASNNGSNIVERPPVLMMHGLFGSSPDWVVTGPNKSLAFLLHDHGYDVWMGNNRGTQFSKNHLTLDPKNSQYWDFSWHEFGMYDTPALIDYVLGKTNYTKLYYVGYSEGCTQFYVMASLKPEYNDKVILMTAMAPAAFTGNVKGFLQPLAPLTPAARFASEHTTYFEMSITSEFLKYLMLLTCRKETAISPLCRMFAYLVAGFGARDEWNEDDVPEILEFLPASSSSKQLLHYGMGMNNPGHFRPYDYGYYKNLKVYNAFSPPEYPLHKITAPVAIYNGRNDWLATPEDIEILVEKLPNVVNWLKVKVKVLNHLDFLFGNNIRSLVYNHVLDRMEKLLPVTK